MSKITCAPGKAFFYWGGGAGALVFNPEPRVFGLPFNYPMSPPSPKTPQSARAMRLQADGFTRSPSSALLPFLFWGRVPLLK